ncbi:polynucleotide 5'-hydroxyl-kinase NOL9 [Ipomoea triloba]|uniref:polynucleotide 5'-hydroxyl-kinase NOL9 n=1 Tax=Ipomoea triloba TaxID=35885 RepID=UPI00125D49BD|nr:polynucleotide 5'-hydroxyl-kinase NOL9 [Ipomoea triloba]XP_031102338.1 polynucleotide 5'-hydroxyl-kinase NOL9 [Ipomoea triloba]
MASALENEIPSPDIIIPNEWSDAADTIAYDSVTLPPPVSFICGPKNCGKTTFSRHLLHVLLNRYRKVAYLDTDVGQTEFTPPGFLSLTIIDKIPADLTIPCLKTPERCFFFGDVSSKRDPKLYLTYACALYDHYQKKYCMLNNSENPANAEMPIVINTPGWVKGIGYEILVDILKYISPSHVVKIRISAESKNLPAGAFWLDEGEAPVTNLIEINSARQDSSRRSILVQKDARLLRDLRIIAYFRQCFPNDANITTSKELAHALAAHPPYEISISSVKIKHLHCQVPKDEVFYSLNATIVGLAVSPEDMPHCVGLGIVRGIDTTRQVLYLITPVPLDSLKMVDLLLQGFIEIPTSLLQVQGCISPYMSANVLPAY